MKSIEHSGFIKEIKDFWSHSKCNSYIKKSESLGYKDAMIQTDSGQKINSKIRNNKRVLFESKELADEIFLDLKGYLPEKIGNSSIVGLNELFRFYKYEPGQEFKKHKDQSFIRNETEASYFTFMIYLNDKFVGGETTFDGIKITPRKGNCLIFLHDLEHEGSKLIEGTKYVLRTDLMYKLNEYPR
ncbi:MAG: 2OG-Fe(II) oxygenase [Bacteroidota bacterium]